MMYWYLNCLQAVWAGCNVPVSVCRYWTPDCREYHRQAWAMVGAQTQPMLNAVPLLQTPVGFVQRWFESAMQPQAHQQ